MAHDHADPPARGRPAPVLVEPLQHNGPALLQRVVRHVVVARHAAGERQEPASAAADPLFEIALQQGTPDCFPERGIRRRAARLSHDRDFRIPRGAVKVRAPPPNPAGFAFAAATGYANRAEHVPRAADVSGRFALHSAPQQDGRYDRRTPRNDEAEPAPVAVPHFGTAPLDKGGTPFLHASSSVTSATKRHRQTWKRCSDRSVRSRRCSSP